MCVRTLEVFVACVAFCSATAFQNASVCRASDPEEMEQGRRLFEKEWKPNSYRDPFLTDLDVRPNQDELGDGLGPLFNAKSCVACHPGGGSSGVQRNVTMLTIDPRSGLFQDDYSTGQGRRELVELYPGVFTASGAVALATVLHESSTEPGFEILREIVRTHVPETVGNSWFLSSQRTSEAIAARPVLAGRYESIDFYLSQRSSPPLFGLGAIDQISLTKLESVAKRQASRTTDQISGRVGNGKFGWRAQTKTLLEFVSGACAGELGLAQASLPQPLNPNDWAYRNRGFDITAQQCEAIAAYVSSLPAPTPPQRMNTSLRLGKGLFKRIGCADCHVENVDSVVGIYSDLLLHDMGEQLQAPAPAPIQSTWAPKNQMDVKDFFPFDSPAFSGRSSAGYYGTPPNRLPLPIPFPRPAIPRFPRAHLTNEHLEPKPEEEMTWDELQREWRTPPLWALMNTAPYLHDGRATTIEQAILWHGGEAAASVERFRNLKSRNRDRLLAFLRTLTYTNSPTSATIASSRTSNF